MIQGPYYPPRSWFPDVDERTEEQREADFFALQRDYEPGIEYEQSTITIPLKMEKIYGDQTYELLVFDAYMQLRREQPEEYNIAAPGTKPISRRQFRFRIEHWELVGKEHEGVFPGAFSRAFDAFISIALARQITELQSKSDLARLEELEKEITDLKAQGLALSRSIHGAAAERAIPAAERSKFEATRGRLVATRQELNALRANVSKQPYSLCHADQMGEDFPATIVYSAHFDIWKHEYKRKQDGSLGPELVTTILLENQAGVAVANKIHEIPPTNVMVAFEKPYENKELGIKFASGTCSGMRHITRQQFLAGANRGRALRGLPPLT
jgi:hypothetical protein